MTAYILKVIFTVSWCSAKTQLFNTITQELIFYIWLDTELVTLILGPHHETVVIVEIFCDVGLKICPLFRICSFFVFCFPTVFVWVHPLYFLSLGDNQDRGPPVPLVLHHKLTGFADIELKMIFVAPRDKTLSHYSLREDSMFLMGNYHWYHWLIHAYTLIPFIQFFQCLHCKYKSGQTWMQSATWLVGRDIKPWSGFFSWICGLSHIPAVGECIVLCSGRIERHFKRKQK